MLALLAVKFQVPEITVFRRAQRLNLEFKVGGHNKGLKKNEICFKLEDILAGKHPQYNASRLKRRLLSEGIKKNECEICGITDWLGKPIVLQLDHVNGDSHDHRLENVRIVCPNCHSQTETYCGRNNCVS